MKYIRTAISEQETTINILYDEQIIKVYSSRGEVIKILTKQLGNPTIKYKKNKSYWSGASWDIEFNDIKKIEKILLFKSFIDSEIEVKEKKKTSKIKKVTTKKNDNKPSEKKIKVRNIKNTDGNVKNGVEKKETKKVKKIKEDKKKTTKKVAINSKKNNVNTKKNKSEKIVKKDNSNNIKKKNSNSNSSKKQSIKKSKTKEFEQASII